MPPSLSLRPARARDRSDVGCRHSSSAYLSKHGERTATGAWHSHVANHPPSCPLGQHREAPTATHTGRVVPVGHRKVSHGWSKWEILARARVRRVSGGDSPNTCFDDASASDDCGLAERRRHEPRRRNRLIPSPLRCGGSWAAVTPYCVLKSATESSLLALRAVNQALHSRALEEFLY